MWCPEWRTLAVSETVTDTITQYMCITCGVLDRRHWQSARLSQTLSHSTCVLRVASWMEDTGSQRDYHGYYHTVHVYYVWCLGSKTLAVSETITDTITQYMCITCGVLDRRYWQSARLSRILSHSTCVLRVVSWMEDTGSQRDCHRQYHIVHAYYLTP